MKLIGISGKKGAGKDLAAKLIQEEFPEFQIIHFADPLKVVTSIITETTLSEQYTRSGKASIPSKLPYTIGRYQQIIGEALRVVDPDIWIRITMKKCGIPTIIADVRYLSEVNAIKLNGGTVIRINRDSFIEADGRDPLHPSEIELDNYPFECVIDNNGTIEELRSKLFERIKIEKK